MVGWSQHSHGAYYGRFADQKRNLPKALQFHEHGHSNFGVKLKSSATKIGQSSCLTSFRKTSIFAVPIDFSCPGIAPVPLLTRKSCV